MNNDTTYEENKLYDAVDGNGIDTLMFKNWNDFFTYINNHMGECDVDYIWRGQADSIWEIVASLKRYNGCIDFGHLFNFQNAIAGLTNTTFKISEGEDNAESERLKLWALGQHYGLATPLIDWTQFPFVALFFAFHEPENQTSPQEYRAIYALNMTLACFKNHDIMHNGNMGFNNFWRDITRPPYSDEFIERLISRFDKNFPKVFKDQLRKNKTLQKENIEQLIGWQKHSLEEKTLRFYYPKSNENYRVYNQGGLFCYTPDNMSVEEWVRKNTTHEHDRHILRKFLVPNRDRQKILKALNKMRVNYLSLFPDFEGAAKYCNMALKEGEKTLSSVRAY